MKIIYEAEITDKKTGDKTMVVATKTKATHKHICRHDEGLPCSREAL